MKKRILSIVLSIVMLVSLLPTTALAMPSNTHTAHYICGVANCTTDHNGNAEGTGHSEVAEWTAWDGSDKDTASGGIQLTEGSWYLTQDVTGNGTTKLIRITGAVNLCLNGYSITNSGYNVIEVQSGATLNICDCTGTGSIKYTGSGTSYSAVSNSGTLSIYNGALSGGRGIYNHSGYAVTIYGGSISAAGDGIYNESGGTVTIFGGTVSGSDDGILNVGTVNISGGDVIGDVDGIDSGTVNINGGNVSGADCGINVAKATISGGTVKATDSEGYGIFADYDDLILSGNPSITGPAADIYLDDPNSSAIITIGGVLTNTMPIIVGMKSYGTFTSGWNTYMSGVKETDLNKYFTPADNGYIVAKSSSSGELTLSSVYTVTYDGNDATSGTAPVDGNSPYTYGKKVTVPGNTGNLAKTGYVFLGWNKNADGTGTTYAPGNTFYIYRDTTLYAMWGIPVTGVVLNKDEISLTVGQTETLTATVSPDDATNKAVSWSSDKENIATVDQSGVVTAGAPGEATITATTADGNFTRACTVMVSAPAETHSHDMSVACGNDAPVTFTAWDGTDKDGETEGIQLTAGSWYLTDDVTLTETLIISSGTVNLCLNGHSITVSGADAIAVSEGATLNLCDCSGNGTVSSTLKGISNKMGTVNVYGGTITGGTYGIYNGIISQDKASTVNIYGGTVTGTQDVGIYNYYAKSTANILGGEVNSGIDNIVNSVLNISGGTVNGSVFSNAGTTTNISAGTVNGVFEIWYGDVTVSGGTIGAIYNSADTFTLSGKPTINGAWPNEDEYSGFAGQILLVEGAVITIGDTLTCQNPISVMVYKNGSVAGTFTSGWTEKMGDAEYGKYFTSADSGYTVQPNGSGELELVAPTICTVTYTDNVANETVFSDVQLSVQSGETAPTYPNGTPSRTGYTFDGWYTSEDNGVTLSDTAYDFDTPVTGDLTLYATWTPENLTGTVSISGTPAVGQTLTATVIDTNNTGTLSFQWWRFAEDNRIISGAVEETYTVTESDVGWKIYCVISSNIQTGAINDRSSAVGPVLPLTFADDSISASGYAGQYDEQEHEITVTAPEGASVEYSTDNENWSAANPSFCNAGSYTVYYRVSKTGYTSVTGSATVAISPKAVNEPTVSGTYTYNGSEQTVELNGFDSSYMTITGGNKETNADDYEVILTLDTNHTWEAGADGMINWSIAPATPTVTWPVGTAYVNDESVILTGGSAAGVGTETSVAGSFTLSTVDLASAGIKTVKITFTPASTNYESVEKADFTVTVSKRTVLSVANQTAITNAVYGTEQAAIGLPETAEITVSGAKKFTVPVTWAGYKAIELEAQTLNGALDLTTISAEVEQPATPITASIVVDLQEKNATNFEYRNKSGVYSGTEITHEISGELEGVESISYSYVGVDGTEYAASADAPTNAGTYEVTATFTMQTGYAAVAPKTAALTISQKEIGLDWSSFTAEQLVYSGTAKTMTATATGLIDGDSCTVTVELVGDNVNVGTFSYKAVELSNENYKLPDEKDGPAYTITSKVITITADDKEAYVYSRQPELTYTVEGLVGDDVLTTAPVLTTDANMNRVGTYTITASGADAGDNYSINYVDGTLTVKNYPYIPQPTYDVEIADDIIGGEVSASKKLAYKGDTITITVEPDAGYELTALTVTDSRGNAVAVTKVSDSKYTFKMPGYDVEIDAVFAKIDTTCPRDWTCPMYGYTDLDRTLWYHDGIHYCIEHGLMQGVGNNQFAPDSTTTRAMIVTILWRLEGSPSTSYAMSFEDVESGKWYTEAIRWAQANGIVSGYSDKAFGPNDIITREQLATILYRYEQYKGGGFTGAWMIRMDYVDLADVSDWAYEAMCWMNMNAVINGKPGKILDPKGTATRAEAAAMLQRYCELNTEKN